MGLSRIILKRTAAQFKVVKNEDGFIRPLTFGDNERVLYTLNKL